MIKITVVIPTLNEERHIGRLLKSLKNQSVKPFEIIVVDGKSKDKTKKEVKKIKGVSFYEIKKGVARQRNYGAKKAKGEIIYFLDADTALPNRFIERTLRLFNKKKYDLACTFYTPFRKNIFILIIYEFFNLIFFIFQKILPSGAGMCMIVKRNVFGKVGGFNEEIKFEDMELIRRISKGFSFGIIPIRIWVSDRRFRRYGIIKMLFKYLYLSFLFNINKFDWAEKVSYPFGQYGHKKYKKTKNLKKKK